MNHRYRLPLPAKSKEAKQDEAEIEGAYPYEVLAVSSRPYAIVGNDRLAAYWASQCFSDQSVE